MKTEQINIRLEPDLVAALERVAREEALDRGTAIRRLLETSIRQWEIAHAPSQPTLPDISPKQGGVLLVGINPAPVSVAAGHYYQGPIGRRLWRRLEHVGLLEDPLPGAEDEAFARAGHGLTDLVKRPTPSSSSLTEEEFVDGADRLRAKIKEWKPGLILFAFKEPARRLLGDVEPGAATPFEGVPTFLLSGPYAPRAERERIDEELVELVRDRSTRDSTNGERSQRVTESDLARGQIRFPRTAKRFFPSERTTVDVLLRGTRITGSYDPRTGPDRERSAVLRVERSLLGQLVDPNEVLLVSRALGGVARLD